MGGGERFFRLTQVFPRRAHFERHGIFKPDELGLGLPQLRARLLDHALRQAAVGKRHGESEAGVPLVVVEIGMISKAVPGRRGERRRQALHLERYVLSSRFYAEPSRHELGTVLHRAGHRVVEAYAPVFISEHIFDAAYFHQRHAHGVCEFGAAELFVALSANERQLRRCEVRFGFRHLDFCLRAHFVVGARPV